MSPYFPISVELRFVLTYIVNSQAFSQNFLNVSLTFNFQSPIMTLHEKSNKDGYYE